eukprot:jgi/Chlat1/2014/Chrsp158S02305
MGRVMWPRSAALCCTLSALLLISASAQNVVIPVTTLPVGFPPEVGDHYLCFSMFYDQMQRWMGLGLKLSGIDGIDPFLIQLLKNFNQYNHKLVLRVNTSPDGVTYDDTAGSTTDPTDWSRVTRQTVTALHDLVGVAGIQLLPVLGYSCPQEPFPLNMTFVARLLEGMGVENIVGIEQANEPDTFWQDPNLVPYLASSVSSYPAGKSMLNWSYPAYAAVFESFAKSYNAELTMRSPLANVPKDIWVGGVITASYTHPWLPYLPSFIDTYMTGPNRLSSTFSWHYYSMGKCSQPDYNFTLTDLMTRPKNPTYLVPLIQKLNNVNAHAWITEHGTASCGGVGGVSDTFAAAIHEVHSLLMLASDGFEMTCLTTNTGAYTPFIAAYRVWNGVRDPWQVRPVYYSAIIAAETLRSGAKVEELTITDPNAPPELEAWAVYSTDGSYALRVVLVYNALSNTPYAQRPQVQVSFDLPESRSAVPVKRLVCDSSWNTYGITWGGQTYDGSVDGKLVGTVRKENAVGPTLVGTNTYRYTVAIRPAEVAMLYFPPRPAGPPPPPFPPPPPPPSPPPPLASLRTIRLGTAPINAPVFVNGANSGAVPYKTYYPAYIGATVMISAATEVTISDPSSIYDGLTFEFAGWGNVPGATSAQDNPLPLLVVDVPEVVYVAYYTIITPSPGEVGSLPKNCALAPIGGTFPTGVWFEDGLVKFSAGGEDIWGSADEMTFVYQTVTPAELLSAVAYVNYIAPTAYNAKAGVMVRMSTAPNAMNVYVSITANGIAQLTYRDASGITVSRGTRLYGPPPVWLRIDISETTIQANMSKNGQDWDTIGTIPQFLPVALTASLAGVAGTPRAGQGSTVIVASTVSVSTAQIQRITVRSWNISAPVYANGQRGLGSVTVSTLLGKSVRVSAARNVTDKRGVPFKFMGWSQGGPIQSICNVPICTAFFSVLTPLPGTRGSMLPGFEYRNMRPNDQTGFMPGGAFYDAWRKKYIMTAPGGNGVGGTADSIGLVYTNRTVSSSVSVGAKVEFIGYYNYRCRVGVMLRLGQSSYSPSAYVYVTSTGYLGVSTRSTDYGFTRSYLAPLGVKLPVWLSLSMDKNALIAQYSTDGVTFTTFQVVSPPPFQVAGQSVTIALAGTTQTQLTVTQVEASAFSFTIQ